MPSYDYICPEDKTIKEVQHHMGETIAVICDCGQLMKRMYMPTAVSFKGGGFYRTDSRTVRKSARADIKSS